MTERTLIWTYLYDRINRKPDGRIFDHTAKLIKNQTAEFDHDFCDIYYWAAYELARRGYYNRTNLQKKDQQTDQWTRPFISHEKFWDHLGSVKLDLLSTKNNTSHIWAQCSSRRYYIVANCGSPSHLPALFSLSFLDCFTLFSSLPLLVGLIACPRLRLVPSNIQLNRQATKSGETI